MIKDITGQRFGRVIAIERVGMTPTHQCLWKCVCDCGKQFETIVGQLCSGKTQSCGCARVEVLKALLTKGGRETPEYRAYADAKSRCTNTEHEYYPNYGGRGILFLFDSFEQFYQHLGAKPSPELSLDRINNDGHYEIGNVRWATAEQQANNRRMPKKAAL